MIGRRAVTGALALGLTGLPRLVEGQRAPRAYRIGVLTTAWAANHPSVDGLKAGLRALGLEENRGLTFDIRFTEGNLGALPAAAAALATAGVDVMFTSSESATLAAAAVTRTIPIAFVNVGDPVASGIVAEVAHPGSNVTGVSNLATELAPKRLEILKELVPGLRRVWAIYDAAEARESRMAIDNARPAARLLKLELLSRPVHTPAELSAAFRAVRAGDGLFVQERATSLDIASQVVKVALRARAVTVFSNAFWVGYGALVSYGADYHAVGFQAARLVVKLLRGAQPQDVPVEGANKIGLAINRTTARALGLTIPQALLLRAEQVID